MSGYARRDLAAVEPWEASLQRSRARRERAGGQKGAHDRTTRRRAAATALVSPISLAALIDARREAARDLADSETWELSLGRSRARRRARELRFVPNSTRARRASLGALVAVAAAPASALLDSAGSPSVAFAAAPEPMTTSQHYITLRSGSEGRQVRLLQQALGVPVDGVYGPATEAAVRRFQETRGLTVDGVLGAATARALAHNAPPALSGAGILRGLSGETRETAPGRIQEAANAAAVPAVSPDVAIAITTGAATAATSASTLSEVEGAEAPASAPRTSETGIAPGETFGGAQAPGEAEAEAAEGSSEAGGSAAGETGGNSTGEGSTGESSTGEGSTGAGANAAGSGTGSTQDAGAGAGTGTTGAAGGEAASDSSTGANAAITPGSGEVGALARASALAAKQTAEAEAEAKTHAIEHLQAALRLPVDGEFGPQTLAAVRRLQARHGLPQDGVAGASTWKVLGQHDEPELTPPPSALHPHRVHKPRPFQQTAQGGGALGGQAALADAVHPAGRAGGKASAIRLLQEALHVSADGEFGPETESAVRHLQAEHGLHVDGVVGPATWSALGIAGERELHPPASAFPHHSAGGGSSAGSSSGGETSSTGGEGVVARVIAAADEIATRPYVWGGGHGSFISSGYDCSGSVSYALHGGGLLSSPEDSTGLESFGEPGPGRYITIYANAEHAWMTIDGRRFDTVALAETGTRWSDSMASTGGYVVRHPAGL
jgi:peptidoglycan hydrolase-like protein with peptidoglycan-binding domain